jgi:hypothetical protein
MITPNLHQMVRELVEPMTQATRTPDGQTVHRVAAPALLDQLAGLEASSGEAVRRGFGSRPAARIEAIDAAARIDREASQWVKHLGEDDPATVKAVVRKLYSMTANLDQPTVDDITHSVRRWWTMARVLSGWDSAAFQPRNTCPHCERLGTLRIQVTDRLAHCIECRSTWDSATIGVLAAWIRNENGDTAA